MRTATTLLALFAAVVLMPQSVSGQTVDYSFSPANTTDLDMPYTTGLHSGARGVTGPYDTDDDGLLEIIVTDYSSGGRVHVLENAGIDTWELVYSVPFMDSTAQSNARYAVGDIDLDGDGNKEIAFVSGRDYSATNPHVVDGTFREGLFVFEYTGTDNDYGTLPAFVCEFEPARPYILTEQFDVADIDGDGVQEIMMPHNGANADDRFYVYSVTGEFEPDGAASSFATCNSELTLSREDAGVDFTFGFLGGGSPFAMHAADLDGDGTPEISLHAWNSFNFFNVDVTGADTYALPDTSQPGAFYQATAPADHYSIFGGVVVDIDGNGDDEVFYPRIQSTNVSLLNYESGDNPLTVDSTTFILDLLTDFTNFGIAAGDVTRDGNPDLIGAGTSFTGSDFDLGNPSSWIKVAAWIGQPGADPEDPANYSIRTFDTSSPVDSTHLNRVVRDSAGTVTVYHESSGKFSTKLAYLGDADNDGDVEIAVAFQSVLDSVMVIDEVWNADSSRFDRTTRSTVASPAREFVRILSARDYNVAIEDTRIITPDQYVLEANYPNPFSDETTIGFELPLDKRISVKIYDITGRLVRTLVNDEQYLKGTHAVTWDGRSASGAAVASGTYLYTLEYGNFRKSRQMVIVK